MRNLQEIIPAFFTGPGGSRLTAEQIAARRASSKDLIAGATDTSPNAGGWASILTKALMGGMAGYDERTANNAYELNQKEDSNLMAKVAAALSGGGSAMPTTTANVASALVPSGGGMPAQTAMVEGQPPVPGLQRAPAGVSAESIRAGLIQRGLPEHVADAFVVNFQDESGLNPGINEAKPLVPGSRGGFGLYQLTGPRRVAYEQYAAERGLPLDSVDAQLDFMMMEGQGSEKKAFDKILSAPDKATAAQAIVNDFLRPAPEYRRERAQRYASLGSLSTPETSSGGIMDAISPPMSEGYFPPAPQAGGIDPVVIEVLSSPYASPQTKQVAYTLLDRSMAQQQQAQESALQEQQRAAEIQRRQQIAQAAGINPAYAMDDAMWAEAAKSPFAAPSTSTVGNTVIDNRTGQPLYEGRPDLPTSVQEFEYGQKNPAYFETQERLKRAGAQNIDLGGNKFDEQFGSMDAKTLTDVGNAGMSAMRNLGRIDQLEGLLAEAPSGFSALLAQRAGEFGIKTEGLDNLQAAQALINSLVPEQRPPGSGPMSDADLELFKQSLPRLINQPEGNRRIIETMRGIAQYDAEGARILQNLRAGNIDRATAFQQLQSRANPLSDFKAPPSVKPENPLPPNEKDGWTVIGGVKIRAKGGN